MEHDGAPDGFENLKASFIKCIPILAKTYGLQFPFITGTVTGTADVDNRLCNVTSVIDGEQILYQDVLLSPEQNDGLIEVPAEDSTVILAKMANGEKYILKCSDVDKIICYINSTNYFVFDSGGFVFNGGLLDGMVKVNSLVTKLNNSENRENDIVLALSALASAMTTVGSTPLTGTALGSAITMAISSIITPLPLTIKPDLENPSIKQ